ncbi:MAG: DNA (cytosine-5-)-methyltransferase [Rhodobacteraceae bacterium]|nr:DNA (cytosine-5-)-methyltransferase [Paracoccaceae bacterium]
MALSVEFEQSAYETLLMRAFLRKFGQECPQEYKWFLETGATQMPDWGRHYPKQWTEAARETLQMELGTSRATKEVLSRIRRIRSRNGKNAVLLGGPPCQSYSLIGRSRNAGNLNYDPARDKRQSLYLEYVKVLGELRPAVAVMENVKGMLSARFGDELIMDKVLLELRNAAGIDSYRLFTVSGSDSGAWDEDRGATDFLVRAEEHGIPQTRHRVIIVCVRNDIVDALPAGDFLRLKKCDSPPSVLDVIGCMPKLRSRLSRGDNLEAWCDVVMATCKRLMRISMPGMTSSQMSRFRDAVHSAERVAAARLMKQYAEEPDRTSLKSSLPFRNWIQNANIGCLPNNDRRGHMPSDIGRYLFAAAFAIAKGTSPRSADFPDFLVPNHMNWRTGKFTDRFRVQIGKRPSSTITSHISKDGHYYIHPDPTQCRSFTVREAARLQTFPDDYLFMGGRTRQYVQVGNAVPPYLALQIARRVASLIEEYKRSRGRPFSGMANRSVKKKPKRYTAISFEPAGS